MTEALPTERESATRADSLLVRHHHNPTWPLRAGGCARARDVVTSTLMPTHLQGWDNLRVQDVVRVNNRASVARQVFCHVSNMDLAVVTAEAHIRNAKRDAQVSQVHNWVRSREPVVVADE